MASGPAGVSVRRAVVGVLATVCGLLCRRRVGAGPGRAAGPGR